MSDASMDPRAGGHSAADLSEEQRASKEQPASEEQGRAYAEQLRAAPADQVAVELLGSVLNVAQAKIGRNDARVFIDIAGLMFDQTRAYLPNELVGQAETMLGELRLVQVEAESLPGRAPEEGDLPAPPTQPPANAGADGGSSVPTGQAGHPGAGQQPRPARANPARANPGGAPSSGSAASKLWLPGRDF